MSRWLTAFVEQKYFGALGDALRKVSSVVPESMP
jgi:hypothetical protein